MVPGAAAIPTPGREYNTVLGMTLPGATTGGLRGPFTRWYPGGGVESHGEYVVDGSRSVAEGVWGGWYPDGRRKIMGRYERGRPVGCFALWDEQGNQVTGIVDGNELKIEPCKLPADDALTDIETRSDPASKRKRWGDVSLRASAQSGTFGASNPTQIDPDPSARATVHAGIRKHFGRFRVGPALALRFSDTDARAYVASAVAAFEVPLHRRVAAEIEVQMGVQYFEVVAKRLDLAGRGRTGFWSPISGARLSMSYTLMPSFQLVGGVSLDGALVRDSERSIRYCAPDCTPPVIETWKIGGAAYGVDLGLRLQLR